AAPRGGLPVDLVVAVARLIFAQFLELAPAPHRALHLGTVLAMIEKDRRELTAFGKQVGINADLTRRDGARAQVPKSQPRGRLAAHDHAGITPAPRGCRGPLDGGGAGAR